ncbi:winged helix-turn-helix domain-containing protein [Thermoplasmatota archaeon]
MWRILNNEGDIEIHSLVYKLQINENDIYSAIGWLARENKIKIKKNIYTKFDKKI